MKVAPLGLRKVRYSEHMKVKHWERKMALLWVDSWGPRWGC